MGVDYASLCTWRTPDLMHRDGKLLARVHRLGMRRNGAIIHIVALVCTSGVSLPINLVFCIRHAYRYSKAKKERLWIRQILGSRNVAYQGRGQWVNLTPAPNGGHWVNPGVNVSPAPHGVQWVNPGVNVSPAPHGVQWVNPGVNVSPAPHGVQWVNPIPAPHRVQWVNPTPAPHRVQWANPTPAPHVSHFNMHIAQEAVNEVMNDQQNFAGNNTNDQFFVPDDQSYLYC